MLNLDSNVPRFFLALFSVQLDRLSRLSVSVLQ